MKRPSPEQREILAGEYAIGTLGGAARQRYERLRVEDATYCYPVDDWENRLAPLVEVLPARQPPASVWAGIEGRLDESGTGAAKDDRSWRLLAVVAAGLLALLALASILF
jgi:anti-sigma-K factor RskA